MPLAGFEEITKNLTPEERQIVRHLVNGFHNHRGRKNAIKQSKISESLKTKFGLVVKPARFRKMVNFIRKSGLVSCLCSTSNGYYKANKPQEIQQTILSLTQRVREINAVRLALIKQYEAEFNKTYHDSINL